VEDTQKRIEDYRRDNKDIIQKNLSRSLGEEKNAAHRLEREKKDKVSLAF
jgi:hypothetical protein